MEKNSIISNKVIHSPIISCSRRTDIPAFLMDWVIERINIGYVDVVNPFNRKQISRVSLKSDAVKCWVWWSKNFKNWIRNYEKYPELFKSYKGHYFQFTINSPSELEQNINISLKERFSQLKWLINEFGVNAISFRFDPIILYRRKNEKEIKSNLDKFEHILENISTLGLKSVTFSFATIYAKVKNRMQNRGFVPIEPSFIKKKEILKILVEKSEKYQLQLEACCQPDLIDNTIIKQAHCIDTNKIEKLIGEEIHKVKDTGQRKGCGCFKSKDIGGYTGIFRCKHNCAYCYASPAKM